MENLLLELFKNNAATVVSFVIGIVVTLVYKKVLTPKQKEQVNEIAVDVIELYNKVANLIKSVETDPIKQNAKLSNVIPLNADEINPHKEIKGNDKKAIVLETINERFTEYEKSNMIKKSGSIISFINDAYSIAKPAVDLIRLIKKGK